MNLGILKNEAGGGRTSYALGAGGGRSGRLGRLFGIAHQKKQSGGNVGNADAGA
jgi:hypothetical protein